MHNIYFSFPDDALSYSCQNCYQACCRWPGNVGITPTELSRLHKQYPEMKVFCEKGKTTLAAFSRVEACRFLDEKGLCRLHLEGGFSAKFVICRLYPVQFMLVEPGTTLAYLMFCPTTTLAANDPENTVRYDFAAPLIQEAIDEELIYQYSVRTFSPILTDLWKRRLELESCIKEESKVFAENGDFLSFVAKQGALGEMFLKDGAIEKNAADRIAAEVTEFWTSYVNKLADTICEWLDFKLSDETAKIIGRKLAVTSPQLRLITAGVRGTSKVHADVAPALLARLPGKLVALFLYGCLYYQKIGKDISLSGLDYLHTTFGDVLSWLGWFHSVPMLKDGTSRQEPATEEQEVFLRRVGENEKHKRTLWGIIESMQMPGAENRIELFNSLVELDSDVWFESVGSRS